jgi:hypothetical protein
MFVGVALEERRSEVRRRGPALTTAARLLWVVAVAILVLWLVLLLVGATTS